MSRARRRPRGYLALVAGRELARLQVSRLKGDLVRAREDADRYQGWYLGGVHIIAGLQTDLAHATGRLERLLADAEHDAPIVSGWKVDLDQANTELRDLREENAVLRRRIVQLEHGRATEPVAGPAPAAGVLRHPGPSPTAVRAEVFARLAKAAPDPADPPQPVVPLWDRDTRRNAS